MSKIFFFFTLICGLCFTSAEAFAKNFVSGFEDIPLMEGLKQIESDDIAFGNEETRYLEAQLVAVRKKISPIYKNFTERLCHSSAGRNKPEARHFCNSAEKMTFWK